MSKSIHLRALLILSLNIILISCSYDIKEIELNQIMRGSLTDGESDYFKITLPEDVDKNGTLVFELEPSTYLDSLNDIVSDPNLYISVNENHPNELKHTWASNRFGGEVISIGGPYINPFQFFYIGVHCVEKCNYCLTITNVKSIPLVENKINSFTLKEKTVMKFSFHTKKFFDQLTVNIVGSYIGYFTVYLTKNDASSSNSFLYEPVFYNGYRFTVNNNELENNSDITFDLTVGNSWEKQELNIWLQYDNENIKAKEADIIYDSILENKAICYYYTIEKINRNKDIIISSVLFNGMGFMYIAGFSPIKANQITKNYKSKSNSYTIVQNRVIHLTSENFKTYGSYNQDSETPLYFCFYGEKNTSLSFKVYLYENFKKIQKLNYIYPGLRIEDILPKRALTRYTLELFEVDRKISIFLNHKSGKPKLYLYMTNPDRNNDLLDYDNFQPLKRSNLILEGQKNFKGYFLDLSSESNKCKKNKYTKQYSCYLNAIVECDPNEECIYELFFDHEKKEVIMEEKIIYTNVISEREIDGYSIILNDNVKNIAIVLTQNTGKTSLSALSLISTDDIYKLEEAALINDYMSDVIKISNNTFKTKSLEGIVSIEIKGITYASYSLYYYIYNEEENENYLDQDKISMNLERGNIIKDIFIDNHRFKVYMYDNSKKNKTDLTVILVETDITNLELYIFKDIDDFYISDDKINGYLWKGETKDYVYIDKNDKKYIENDVLYIMVYKKTKGHSNDEYTSFYLGITDEGTPFLLSEGIEFKQSFNNKHSSQTFYYNYVDNELDLKISLSLLFGRLIVNVQIDETFYDKRNIIDNSNLITIPRYVIKKICQNKSICPIYIEAVCDKDYYYTSSFLITVKSSLDVPIYLKQGIVNKRAILSGEEQYFIIDLKPDISFGAKISVFFSNGQAGIFARRALKSELFNITYFPDENNYEYMASYQSSKRGFYLIEIPYEDISDLNPCKILLTIKGLFIGYYGTKIEYTISVSNILNELITDRNHKLFISKGEIAHYHFKVNDNKKRLYISMTNKDRDANMFLNYDKYITSLDQYNWKNVGSYNEYLDISTDDPLFIERQMETIDGDYYLAIQGLDDCFFNLYISTQDVKIMTLAKGSPSSCACEIENDYCYFRYENINDPSIRDVYDQELVFYTEYTYGSGLIYGKLYPNGNMEEIIKNLPSPQNHDYVGVDSNQFLYVNLYRDVQKYTFSSVLVVGIQCKERSLFDLTAQALDKKTDVTRSESDLIFLNLEQDNIFYLSYSTGKAYKFIYYIYKNEDFNFQIKALYGQAEVHTYTNETKTNYKFLENEDRIKSQSTNYHHISDFFIDSDKEESKIYYKSVSKQYTKGNYFYIEVKPVEQTLINIIINYNEDFHYIPINKEIVDVFSGYNYYTYFDILKESEEVIITITALEKSKTFNVFVKKNILYNIEGSGIIDQSRYSMPNSKNYDAKGTTNSLTSAISIKVKNEPQDIKNKAIVRVLVNIESVSYSSNQKIKIMVAPVIHNINRIRPEQNIYYFSGIEKRYTDKTLYMLKNLNKEHDIMVIEISICKGNFMYVLVDSPPKDTETYNLLQKRKVNSDIYASNGKNIIIVKNIEPKEYYLMVYGDKNPKGIFDHFINEDKNDANKASSTELLFKYYTTNQKQYNYLFTQDSFTYHASNDYSSIQLKLPELKNRDSYGKENYVDYMNYTFVVSEKKSDYIYMGSTCYLTKLIQDKEKKNEYDYLKINYDKEKNTLNVDGFLGGKTYYMNILAKNEHTGEAVTYKPIMIVTSQLFFRMKIVTITILSIILVIFVFCAFKVYRKYRIENSKTNFAIENKPESSFKKKFGNLKNINLNIVKKKYNTLSEDNKGLNEE